MMRIEGSNSARPVFIARTDTDGRDFWVCFSVVRKGRPSRTLRDSPSLCAAIWILALLARHILNIRSSTESR